MTAINKEKYFEIYIDTGTIGPEEKYVVKGEELGIDENTTEEEDIKILNEAAFSYLEENVSWGWREAEDYDED